MQYQIPISWRYIIFLRALNIIFKFCFGVTTLQERLYTHLLVTLSDLIQRTIIKSSLTCLALFEIKWWRSIISACLNFRHFYKKTSYMEMAIFITDTS